MNYTINHFTQLISKEKIHNIALECGWYQRAGKISPLMFIELCLNPDINLTQDSLDSLCAKLSKNGITVSKQALDSRINDVAHEFLLLISKEFQNMTTALNSVIDFPVDFKKIYAADCTSITLDPTLTKYMKGLSKKIQSSIKVFYAYDITSFNVLSIDIKEGKTSDRAFNHLVNGAIDSETLILKDMGFSSLKDQDEINEKMGRYIYRSKLSSVFYELVPPKFKPNGVQKKHSEFKKIELSKISATLKDGEFTERTLYLKDATNPKKVKYVMRRIIIGKLPEEKIDARTKSVKSRVRKKEHEVSSKTLDNLYTTVFVTNITTDELSAERFLEVYLYRWNIELLFKQLKSTFKLDDVKRKVKLSRVLCTVTSKLILGMLSMIHSNKIIKKFKMTTDKDLSLDKLGKYLRQCFIKIANKTVVSIEISQYTVNRFLQKETKKSRNLSIE